MEMEMYRMLFWLDKSCALQPLPFLSLESENTALVRADSEGLGPTKEDGG